jgi:Flp pilus assembly protein TadG
MPDRRAGGARRGEAATELAIVVTVLSFMLVATTDFARVFYYYLTVTNCARNGALYGCQDSAHSTDTSGIQTAALSDAGNVSPQPTVTSATGNDSSKNPYVAVTVTYSFSTIVDYLGIPSTINLSRTVQMRVAQKSPNFN